MAHPSYVQEVLDSATIAPRLKDIYLFILEQDERGATGREINAHFETHANHTRCTELKSLGLVTNSSARTCTITNKSAKVWHVTKTGVTGKPRKKKAHPPSEEACKRAGIELSLFITYAVQEMRKKGLDINPPAAEIRKVVDWLVTGAAR